MRNRSYITFCLSACLISIACPSKPSAPGADKATALERKVNFINGLLGQRPLAARIVNELVAALPARVWLTEVVYDSEGIRIKGRSPSNDLIADYVSSLERSSSLTEVNLLSSVQKRARNYEYQEFALRALVKDGSGEKPSKSGHESGPDAVDALTRRLGELEKAIPPGKETADILRQFQLAANDSGLKITKFAPGSEIPGEFTSEWPISIEATGSRQSLRRFFDGIVELPRLWLIKKFSFTAVSNEAADSPVRASITAQTYFLREKPAERAGRQRSNPDM
ncbi:MAG: type 4a pilus biogenesis protein PilO [Candidatus Aminicenantales bacterium]